MSPRPWLPHAAGKPSQLNRFNVVLLPNHFFRQDSESPA
jgi:hypothetical protein